MKTHSIENMNKSKAQGHPCVKVAMKEACSIGQEASQSNPMTDHLLGLEIETSGLQSFDIFLCPVGPLCQNFFFQLMPERLGI